MTDEVIVPSTTEGAPAPATDAPPDDYKAYVKWRKTGELPPREEPPAAAESEETKQAKTGPQSGADETQQSEEEAEGSEKPSRANGRVRKIDRLTRENEQLRAQLAATQQPAPQPAPAPPPKPAEPPGKPHLRDFKTLEEYQEALTDWKMDQREAARQTAAAAEKLQADWQSAETAARTAHPDYDEIIQSVRAPEGPGVPAMRQAMLEDEAGGEVLYHLATHPEELERIAAMQPISAVREIGKLAARLAPPSDAENKKPPPRVSSAPKPPPPLSRPSGQAVKDSIYDEETAADYTRWAKARIAQLKGK